MLAELHRGSGAKLITLVHRLGASHGSILPALEHLIQEGWVKRNPGHGHPLRPEFILDGEGPEIGLICRGFMDAISPVGLQGVALKKWSMPVLWAIGVRPTRFAEIPRSLPGLTDRALSMTLRDLQGADLVHRNVIQSSPPSTNYVVTEAGMQLIRLLVELG